MRNKPRQSDPGNRVWLAIALLGVIAIFVLFGLLLKKTEYSAGASDVSSMPPKSDATANVQHGVEESNTTPTVQVGNVVSENANFREQWKQSNDEVSVSSTRASDPNPCHEVVDWQSGTYIDNCSHGEGYEAQTKRMQTKNPDRAGVDQVIQSTPEI